MGYPSTTRRRSGGNPQSGWLWITLVALESKRGNDIGREKEYRQRLKYQVSCVRRKTLESQIAVQLQGELGMSLAESRLLSRRMARCLQQRSGFKVPNQIVIE